MYKNIIVLLVLGLAAVNGQRVAPGVPPQHYQQPPQQYQQHPQQQQQQYQQHPQQNLPPGVSPQQYQQQQMQQQQMQQQQQQQMQYQQVPVQQQQPPVAQQVPVQQVPVHQQQVPVQQVPQGHHAPHGHHGQQQVLNAANIQHEREHIQEHMQVPIDTSKMSEAELQFHYFKMHDSDNNNKLDGCELIKSLIHWHAEEDKTKEGHKEHEEGEAGTGERSGTTYTDEKLADIIDYVMKTMDLNKDGYVDYTEYRKSEEASAKDDNQ